MRVADVRRYMAVVSLLGYAAYEFSGIHYSHDVAQQAMFGLFGVTLLVAAAGVLKRQFWARLLALGASVGGLLQFAMFALVGTPTPSLIVFAGFNAAVTTTLFGATMAAHMVGGTREGDLWRRGDGFTRLVSAAIIMSVAAVPILLTYGNITRSPGQATVALGLAAAFGTAALLLACQRTAGLLVLFPASAMSAAITSDFVMQLTWKDIAKELLLRWLEGKLMAVVVGVLAVVAVVTAIVCIAFAVPISRYLERKRQEEERRKAA